MVEKQLRKPIMTSFHALCRIGMILGAARGSLLTERGAGIFVPFAVVSGISLASGVLGGFVGAISTASQWKGEISTRIEQLEKLRIEDKIDLKEKYEYLRAQQEVTGRDVSTIKAVVTETNRRRQ